MNDLLTQVPPYHFQDLLFILTPTGLITLMAIFMVGTEYKHQYFGRRQILRESLLVIVPSTLFSAMMIYLLLSDYSPTAVYDNLKLTWSAYGHFWSIVSWIGVLLHLIVIVLGPLVALRIGRYAKSKERLLTFGQR